MRTNMSFPTLLSMLIAGALSIPIVAQAQSTPDATFASTSTAIDGSLTYCGPVWNFLGLLGSCPVVPITPANPVTEGASGNADNVANNLTVMAGTATIGTIGNSNDGDADSDSASNDSGDATEDEQTVSLFNGAVTYTEVQGSYDCVAAAPDGDTVPVTCLQQTTITNLQIQGQPVYPSGTEVLEGTQVPLTNLPVTVNGVQLVLNGMLIIGDEVFTGNGTANAAAEFMPIHIEAQGCQPAPVGCLLGYVNVDLRDDEQPSASVSLPRQIQLLEDGAEEADKLLRMQ